MLVYTRYIPGIYQVNPISTGHRVPDGVGDSAQARRMSFSRRRCWIVVPCSMTARQNLKCADKKQCPCCGLRLSGFSSFKSSFIHARNGSPGPAAAAAEATNLKLLLACVSIPVSYCPASPSRPCHRR